MASARKPFSMDHPIIITFLIFAIIGFMYLAATVLKPLALAVLLAFALAPLCSFLERRGLPRFLAAVLAVFTVLGVLGFVGSRVGLQLDSLAKQLPDYEKHVFEKLKGIQVGEGGSIESVKKFVGDVSDQLAKDTKDAKDAKDPGKSPVDKETPAKVQDVRVVNTQSNLFAEIATTVGPYLETLGVLAFDLILVLFILNNRVDLVDRIIRLFGRGKISLTTKTTEEIGQRISKYLLTFALVNSSVGVIIGLGLWAIGLPYALVWGVLAALLRFVPYAGPASAFALPFAFSVLHFPSWTGPLEVLALFATLEIAANSFLEPVIYGHTTGVSALGLLVAAMFWTWLWGALGLLLSTPLTVCLAVLGKYVPALKIFATFLGEEAALKPDVRFYQRLLAHDQDGAVAVTEEILKENTRVQLFDSIFIPTLSMAERDFARGDIDDDQRDFTWWVVDETVQDLEVTPERVLEVSKLDAPAAAPVPGPDAKDLPKIVGIPTNDRGDLLALRMLQALLTTSGCRIAVTDVGNTPLQIAEKLVSETPSMIVVSYLPPGGLSQARYLVRRLRARFPDVPIVVGRWAGSSEGDSADRLTSVGATNVVATLAEARDRILAKITPPTAKADNASVPHTVGV